MSNVTLEIGGRSYTVACGDGQEAHVAMLGRNIDKKLGSLKDFARQSEARTLLFAALLLADENHELKNGPEVSPPVAIIDPVVGNVNVIELEALADQLENLAASLEGLPQRA